MEVTKMLENAVDILEIAIQNNKYEVEFPYEYGHLNTVDVVNGINKRLGAVLIIMLVYNWPEGLNGTVIFRMTSTTHKLEDEINKSLIMKYPDYYMTSLLNKIGSIKHDLVSSWDSLRKP